MSEKKVIVGWDQTNLAETRFGVVEFNHDKCIGCSWCAQVCPCKAIELVEEKAAMTPDSQCMFCGCCQAICSEDAITLKEPPAWPGYFVILDRGAPEKPRLTF